MVQFFYALFSIIVVTLVIVFGYGRLSNYIPQKEREMQGQDGEGGETNVSTD